MKIAVLLGGISYDSQKRTINGILDKAILDKVNVYIFTCDGWKYEIPSKYEKGENNVYLKTSYFMHVEMENRNGIKEIVDHLIKQHSAANIFFISGPEDSLDSMLRLQAYKDAMTANQVEWSEEQVYYGDYSYEGGRRAVRKFLDEASVKPDAIVTANDEMAVGAKLL